MFSARPKKVITLLKDPLILYIPENTMLDSNVYLIGQQGNLLMIDSGNGLSYKNIVKALDNAGYPVKDNLKAICQTHQHVDHILGLYKFKKDFPEIQVFASETEAMVIESGKRDLIVPDMGFGMSSMIFNMMKSIGLEIFPIKVDQKFKDGDIFTWEPFKFEVLITPGHTPGGLCLYDKEHKVLFSGDTVFPGGSMGRVDFPGGSSRLMRDSLNRLANLDVEILCAGHMPPVEKNARDQIKMSAGMSQYML
ncbi:MAG: MBL fold metallo-hydrolase [Candidatus Helarchaeota archaeon]